MYVHISIAVPQFQPVFHVILKINTTHSSLIQHIILKLYNDHAYLTLRKQFWLSIKSLSPQSQYALVNKIIQ